MPKPATACKFTQADDDFHLSVMGEMLPYREYS